MHTDVYKFNSTDANKEKEEEFNANKIKKKNLRVVRT